MHGAPRAVADARVVGVAPESCLAEQQDQAEHDREERESGRPRRAEPELVLRIDVGAERAEFERDEGVELDEGVEHHEQQAAEQRGAKLRQDHPEEDPAGSESERLRRLLEGGIHPAERDGDEQEDDREVREPDHARCAEKTLQRAADARPGIARHERRHRERCDE